MSELISVSIASPVSTREIISYRASSGSGTSANSDSVISVGSSKLIGIASPISVILGKIASVFGISGSANTSASGIIGSKLTS